jgi:hypothetical protein
MNNTIPKLKEKYKNYDMVQLKIALIAVVSDYTDKPTINKRIVECKQQIDDSNIFGEYELEINVILDLLKEQLNNEVKASLE